MAEEKKTYEYLPENYEEEILQKRRKGKYKKKIEETGDININSFIPFKLDIRI